MSIFEFKITPIEKAVMVLIVVFSMVAAGGFWYALTLLDKM